jgi:hypothetical protein
MEQHVCFPSVNLFIVINLCATHILVSAVFKIYLHYQKCCTSSQSQLSVSEGVLLFYQKTDTGQIRKKKKQNFNEQNAS